MLVSIIVPVYNVEKYLRNCVESILQQTFENFELLLIDDGSPDKCGKICDEFALTDSRVKVFHQENKGLSAARNVGIEMSRGDFLTFIDSDDFIFPHYLEKLISACTDNDADMAVCDFVRCSSNDTLNDMVEVYLDKHTEIFSNQRMSVFFTTNKISTTAWGKLYKRTLFEDVRYPLGKYNEDIFVTYMIVHFSRNVVFSDYQGYVYRKNELSIMNEPFSLKKIDPIEGCLERAGFIEREYPELKKYAYRSIIRFCNQALLSMGKSKAYNQDVFCFLQKLYRRYWRYYVFNKSVFWGKIYTLLSLINVKINYKLTKIFYGRVCRKCP